MTLLICLLFVLLSALPARDAGTTLTAFQLPVLQLRSCCCLQHYGFRNIEPRFLI